MYFKTVAYLLCIAIIVRDVQSKHAVQHTQWSKKENSHIGAITLVNSKYINLAERTLKNFLTKLSNSPNERIILRTISWRNGAVERTICEICRTIRRSVIEFAKELDFTSTVHRYKSNANLSTKSDDWFNEVLLQVSLLFYDLCGIIQEVGSIVNRYVGKENFGLLQRRVPRNRNTPRFLGIIDDLSNFSFHLSRCYRSELQRKPMNQIFAKILKNLANKTPGDVVKIFNSHLHTPLWNDNSSNNNSAQFYVLLCNFAFNRTQRAHRVCIKNFERFDECLASRSYRQIFKLNRRTSSDSRWLKAIADLNNCSVSINEKNGDTNIRCHSKTGKLPRNPGLKMKYVYETFLHRKIPKESPLNRVANDLGIILQSTPWGKRLIDETIYYLSIYRNGVNKVDGLAGLARRDRRAMTKYVKAKNSLTAFKRGLLLKTLNAIEKVHDVATQFQTFLVESIKTTMNQIWDGHIKIMSCVSDWMTALFLLYEDKEAEEEEEENDVSLSIVSSQLESQEFAYESSEQIFDEEFTGDESPSFEEERRESADEAFKKLMKSMNRVNVRSSHENNGLTMLANNLLLTVMFMETVGFVATLFSLEGASKGETQSSKTTENWESGRKRSLSFFGDHLEDDDKLNKKVISTADIATNEETIVFLRDEDKQRECKFSMTVFDENKYPLFEYASVKLPGNASSV